jgi:hypothetical protein
MPRQSNPQTITARATRAQQDAFRKAVKLDGLTQQDVLLTVVQHYEEDPALRGMIKQLHERVVHAREKDRKQRSIARTRDRLQREIADRKRQLEDLAED